jgi:hypothetical protein
MCLHVFAAGAEHAAPAPAKGGEGNHLLLFITDVHLLCVLKG